MTEQKTSFTTIKQIDKAIAFEQDCITHEETFTFAIDGEHLKMLAFEGDDNKCSIVASKEEAVALRDFLNKYIGD